MVRFYITFEIYLKDFFEDLFDGFKFKESDIDIALFFLLRAFCMVKEHRIILMNNRNH